MCSIISNPPILWVYTTRGASRICLPCATVCLTVIDIFVCCAGDLWRFTRTPFEESRFSDALLIPGAGQREPANFSDWVKCAAHRADRIIKRGAIFLHTAGIITTQGISWCAFHFTWNRRAIVPAQEGCFIQHIPGITKSQYAKLHCWWWA